MNPYTRSVEPAWQNPRHVFLSEKELRLKALDLNNHDLKIPNWRLPIFPEKDDETFIEFLAVANSINFCFTDFKTGKKPDIEYPKGSGQIWYGSMALAAALKRALDENIPILDKRFLTNISYQQFAKIFETISTPFPMPDERLKNLHNIGRYLIVWQVESFSKLFKNADFRAFNSGNGIVEKLVSLFDSYKDLTFWKGHFLAFHKRAQLTVLEYQGRALSSNGKLPLLKDAESIGPIADYQVPRTLRSLQILEYQPELAVMIDSGTEIPAGGDFEVEIRAQTIHAVMLLLSEINQLRKKGSRPSISMLELDYLLWVSGRGIKQPHHYTFTTAY